MATGYPVHEACGGILMSLSEAGLPEDGGYTAYCTIHAAKVKVGRSALRAVRDAAAAAQASIVERCERPPVLGELEHRERRALYALAGGADVRWLVTPRRLASRGLVVRDGERARLTPAGVQMAAAAGWTVRAPASVPDELDRHERATLRQLAAGRAVRWKRLSIPGLEARGLVQQHGKLAALTPAGAAKARELMDRARPAPPSPQLDMFAAVAT